MGFKDFLYTEKGKIAGSVLAAVLLTTTVMVPVSIYTDRAMNDEVTVSNVKSFGYDDNKTSTGLRQDNWMGIDTSTMIDASGQEVTSMEATLENNNPDYLGVTTDEDLMAGVNNTDGIAYLSYSHVGTDDHLKPLAISEDGGANYIKPGEKGYLSAPLNMAMKVPQGVSAVINDKLSPTPPTGKTNELKISDLNGLTNAKDMTYELDNKGEETDKAIETVDGTESYDYGQWLLDQKLAHDFAISLLAFNYIAQTQMSIEAMAPTYVSPNTAAFADDKAFFTWANEVFGQEDKDTWGIINEKGDGWAFTSEEVMIDGTGTDEAAINLALDSFNVTYPDASLSQNLNNGGSYRAWETVDKDKLPAGVSYNPDEYDGTQNGSKAAFIGTQSRGMEMGQFKKDENGNPKSDASGEISYWGYDEDVYAKGTYGSTTSDDMENIIYDFTKMSTDDETPTATTLATDQVVFFTTVDAKFTSSVDGKTYAPTGVTQTGAKMLFEFGSTWNEVYNLGLLQAELV